MNTINPINLQKVSYLRNSQPQSLSVSNAAGQSTGDAYVPSFKGYEKALSDKKGLMVGLLSLATLFTGIFAKKIIPNQDSKREKIIQLAKLDPIQVAKMPEGLDIIAEHPVLRASYLEKMGIEITDTRFIYDSHPYDRVSYLDYTTSDGKNVTFFGLHGQWYDKEALMTEFVSTLQNGELKELNLNDETKYILSKKHVDNV